MIVVILEAHLSIANKTFILFIVKAHNIVFSWTSSCFYLFLAFLHHYVRNFTLCVTSLSGSGKSYLAKMLRNLEVENCGDAPRIHSMDDYFMTEVEKVHQHCHPSNYV